MPQTQKRKCEVSFGELISFLSMNEEYSPASSNSMQNVRSKGGTLEKNTFKRSA